MVGVDLAGLCSGLSCYGRKLQVVEARGAIIVEGVRLYVLHSGVR
jgi:hypothetical protein